ncbi:hypothetical protein [Streptomyces sp. NPDC087272]|uniref:hypothetical protein n=1 Tax=Streptomyces sp. NPDC087272 TaxID=3365775 RepID=UPI003810A0E8
MGLFSKKTAVEIALEKTKGEVKTKHEGTVTCGNGHTLYSGTSRCMYCSSRDVIY